MVTNNLASYLQSCIIVHMYVWVRMLMYNGKQLCYICIYFCWQVVQDPFMKSEFPSLVRLMQDNSEIRSKTDFVSTLYVKILCIPLEPPITTDCHFEPPNLALLLCRYGTRAWCAFIAGQHQQRFSSLLTKRRSWRRLAKNTDPSTWPAL